MSSVLKTLCSLIRFVSRTVGIFSRKENPVVAVCLTFTNSFVARADFDCDIFGTTVSVRVKFTN